MFPVLDRLANEGELGRRKLNNYTRYLTLVLAIFQSFGLTLAITKMPVPGNIPVVPNPDAFFYCAVLIKGHRVGRDHPLDPSGVSTL